MMLLFKIIFSLSLHITVFSPKHTDLNSLFQSRGGTLSSDSVEMTEKKTSTTKERKKTHTLQ